MRLMFVIALVINVFLALSLVFFRATRKTYPGFGIWTTGVSLLALGYFFIFLRGYIPDSISILAVNLAFPLGMVLHLDGMRRFLGLTPMSRWWYALPGSVLAGVAVFYYGHDSPGLRTLIVSIALSVTHFAIAFLILRRPVRPTSLFYGVIGSMLALGGAIILGRGMWSLYESQYHLFWDSPVQLIFFVSVVVLQLGENLAFIMLNSERLENELHEAEAVLKVTVEKLQQALAEIKTLSGFVPICSSCKKIRDDQGYWQAVEEFIQERSQAKFSHGICPDCMRKLYPGIAEEILKTRHDKAARS